MAPDSFHWIQTDGGPLLLLAESLLPEWGGSDPPSGGSRMEAELRNDPELSATDYDRACDVASDYIATIPIADGHGLVLGQEPFSTTWIPFEANKGGLLVRWVYAENDQRAAQILGGVSAEADWRPEFTLAARAGRHVLFDSAYPGLDLPPHVIRVELPYGRYDVASAWFKPDDDTEFLLHRLVPA